jgi:hypothetical protein
MTNHYKDNNDDVDDTPPIVFDSSENELRHGELSTYQAFIHSRIDLTESATSAKSYFYQYIIPNSNSYAGAGTETISNPLTEHPSFPVLISLHSFHSTPREQVRDS